MFYLNRPLSLSLSRFPRPLRMQLRMKKVMLGPDSDILLRLDDGIAVADEDGE